MVARTRPPGKLSDPRPSESSQLERRRRNQGPIESPPANFPKEPDFEWETFDIGEYTALTPTSPSPQTALLDWIFRRTETGPWHGDKIAVLVANRNQIRAYNSKKILDQVRETVEQFVDAQADVLTVRVRFSGGGRPTLALFDLLATDAGGNRPAGATDLAGS